MTLPTQIVCTEDRRQIHNYLPPAGAEAVTREILAGLTAPAKFIPSKYFYDARGSLLFEEITRLPEYYPTRTEMPLIAEAARHLACSPGGLDVIEIGSGSCAKITRFLDALPKRDGVRYIPLDVSQTALEESSTALLDRYPGLIIHGLVADFFTHLHLLPPGNQRLFCFFGSTLGNFSRSEGLRFCRHLGSAMRPGDRWLLGLDRVKDRAVLEAAYNDRQGITAAFNRNILQVCNDLAGTNFDPRVFQHVAFYNEALARIEMHLEATEAVCLTSRHWPDPVMIQPGERIHTENSHKFTDAHLTALAQEAGLHIDRVLTDSQGWFSLVELSKSRPGSGAAHA